MKKILIINPFGIGDVLFTTPVIAAIKDKYPDSFLGFICNQKSAPVLENNPYVDQVFFFTRGDFKKIKIRSYFKYLLELFRAILIIKKQKFDLSIDLSLVNQYSVIFWLLGIKERWGIKYKQRRMLLTAKINISEFKNKHVLDYYKELLAGQGISNIKNFSEIFLSEKEKDWAGEFLKLNHFNVQQDKQKLIGIAPFGGASWGADAGNKQWPIERFAQIIRNIQKKINGKVILFGSGLERQKAQGLIRQLDEIAIINAVGKTNLREFFSLVACCDLILTNDSGPLHAACALGVKTVSIYGPVDDTVYGPLGKKENNIVLSKKLDCRPCYCNFMKKNCAHMQCLMLIGEKEVFAAIEKLL